MADDLVDPPFVQDEKGALKWWNAIGPWFKKFRRPDGTTFGPDDFAKPSDLSGAAGFLHAYTDQVGGDVAAFVLATVDQKIADALGTGSTKPAPPTITGVVPAVVTGVGQVTVSFTDNGDGNSAITDHNVRLYVNGHLSAIPIEPGASSPIVVIGITLGASYKATVSAINANGESAESAFSAPFEADADNPDAPTLIKVEQNGLTADVFFSIPADNGSPYTGFLATATSSDGGTTRTGTPSGFGASPIHIANLTNGKHYTIVVKSTNAIGDSPNSNTSSSFLVGTPPPPSNVAQTKLGMFTSEPNALGVSFIRANEALLNHHLFGVQINFSPAPGGTDNVWGCTSNPDDLAADGVSRCLGYDTQLHARVQPILDIPLAVGGPSDGSGNGFDMSAAQKITRMNNIANGTYDGTHSSDAEYRLAAKQYYRDRNISCSITSGSNGVDVSTFAGSGTLHVDNTALFAASSAAAGHDLFVDLGAGHGVVTMSYMSKTSTTFAGCTYTGRAAVGGGLGTTVVATGGYVGSGTGFPDFVGRFGWEFDGDWFAHGARKPTRYFNGSAFVPDNTASQAALSTQFIITYRYVVDLFRSFGWDSFMADLTGDPGYFGDRINDIVLPLIAQSPTADDEGAYIECLGHDVYDQDQSNAFNASTKTWQDPAAAWSKMLGYLQLLDTVAQNAGVPISVGEWAGVSDKAAITGDPTVVCGGDNPTFIQGMYTWLNGHTDDQVAFHTYFDSNNEGGNFAIGTNKPNARAKFINLFGA